MKNDQNTATKSIHEQYQMMIIQITFLVPIYYSIMWMIVYNVRPPSYKLVYKPQ